MRNRIKLKRLRTKEAKIQDKRVAILVDAHAIELAVEAQIQNRMRETIENLRAIVAGLEATIARQEQQIAALRGALNQHDDPDVVGRREYV